MPRFALTVLISCPRACAKSRVQGSVAQDLKTCADALCVLISSDDSRIAAEQELLEVMLGGQRFIGQVLYLLAFRAFNPLPLDSGALKMTRASCMCLGLSAYLDINFKKINFLNIFSNLEL